MPLRVEMPKAASVPVSEPTSPMRTTSSEGFASGGLPGTVVPGLGSTGLVFSSQAETSTSAENAASSKERIDPPEEGGRPPD